MSKLAVEDIAFRFLRWFCPPALYEGIEGDLLEQFEHRVAASGRFKARLALAWNVFRFLRPGIVLRNKVSISLIRYAMIRNYIILAYRQATRNRLYTVVNVTGLSLALVTGLLVAMHVKRELQYDTHFRDYSNIYRLASTHWARTPPTLAENFQAAMPEVEAIARLFPAGSVMLQSTAGQTFSSCGYYADTSVFRVFGIAFLSGKEAAALTDPSAIVITRAIAGKLFKAGEDPLGKAIVLDGYQEYTVAGIISDLPRTTHLKMDYFLPMARSQAATNDSRSWKGVATYLRVSAPAQASAVSGKLREFQYAFLKGEQSREDIDRNGDFLELHPITGIHLHSHREKEVEANSDITYVYVFSAFAVLIILVASINFINLFTAQAMRRIKEIGVRKAIGARKGQLVWQFFIEAFAAVLVATVIGMLMVYALLPWYNSTAALNLTPQDLYTGENILLVALLAGITTLLAGGYPAVHIARFRVTDSLKNNVFADASSLFRKGLVTVQFGISILLLAGTLVVYAQMEFIQSLDLGFSREEVISVKLYGNLWVQANHHKEALKETLLAQAGVKHVTLAEKVMGDRFGIESFRLSDRPEEETLEARYLRVDEDFLETLNITLLKGHSFSGTADTNKYYILNESAARQLGEKDLIGRYGINTLKGPNQRPGQVVGIVKDFHYASLHRTIEPLVMEYQPKYLDNLLLRIDRSRRPDVLARLEASFKQLSPGTPLVYTFLGDKLDTLYESENSLYRIAKVLSCGTLLIACLGLFALAAHTSETRTKEIGIRKVMGASAYNILTLLCSDSVKLVAIAFVLAVPVASAILGAWLTGFAYRIDVAWWMFAVPGAIVFILALAAVVMQSLRVTFLNPVKSLRYE